ncbi:hypothetical protein [Lewinella cohaerens]|uniref:hypothetical protein n=1 Tax=Lewinella cohaerens TaxID=70995 RepID=UPI0003A5A624|nr:hypothetical protein [Lewinella cohaerens]
MRMIVIALAGTVFLMASSCQKSRIDTDLLNSMLVSQQYAALQLEEDNDLLFSNTQYLLYSESKKKYRPIGDFMENFRLAIDSIRNELKENSDVALGQQDQNMEKLSHSLIDFHYSVLNDFEKLLLTNDSILFLRENRIKAYCNKLAEAVSFIPETNRELFGKRLTAVERKVALQKVILDLNILEAQVLYFVADLLGGTSICGFSVYEPVVYKNKDINQKEGNTLIVIEEYPEPSQSEDIHLTINGQNIPVYQGLYIAYPDSLLKIHHNTLEFSGIYFNHLTGERNDFLSTDPYILEVE